MRIANTDRLPPDLNGYPAELRPLLERCLTADPAERIGTDELAAMCELFAGRPLNDFDGWLPEPVGLEIARRVRAAENPPVPTVADAGAGTGRAGVGAGGSGTGGTGAGPAGAFGGVYGAPTVGAPPRPAGPPPAAGHPTHPRCRARRPRRPPDRSGSGAC